MKLYLHIGTAKTGSTSIQGFLAGRRRELAEQGVLVPACLGHTSHRAVAAYAQDDAVRDVVRLALGIRTPDELERFRTRIREDFRRELEASGCHTVVVSSEHCHSRLSTVEEAARTRELFGDMQEVKVLVYLRPQDDLAVSRYSSLLRNGETRPQIFPPPGEGDGFYDYLGLLERWSAAYGAGALRPFLFDQVCAGEGLVCHFAREIGVEAASGQAAPPRNLRLDLKVAAFLLEINPLLPKLADDALAPGRSWVGPFCARHPVRVPVLPSAGAAEAFLARFRPGNEGLAGWLPGAAALSRPSAASYPPVSNWPARLERGELLGFFADALQLIDDARRPAPDGKA